MDVTKAVYEAHLLRSTICLQMRYRLCLSFMHANVSENWSNNNKRRCHQRCCWQNTFCWVYRRSPNLWVSFMWPCICLWRAGADISRHKVGNLTSAKPLLYDYIISKKKCYSFMKKNSNNNATWMFIKYRIPEFKVEWSYYCIALCASISLWFHQM